MHVTRKKWTETPFTDLISRVVRLNPRLKVIGPGYFAETTDPFDTFEETNELAERPLEDATCGWGKKRSGIAKVWHGRAERRADYDWSTRETQLFEEHIGLDTFSAVPCRYQAPMAVHSALINPGADDSDIRYSSSLYDVTWAACGLRIARVKHLRHAKKLAWAFADHLSSDGLRFRAHKDNGRQIAFFDAFTPPTFYLNNPV